MLRAVRYWTAGARGPSVRNGAWPSPSRSQVVSGSNGALIEELLFSYYPPYRQNVSALTCAQAAATGSDEPEPPYSSTPALTEPVSSPNSLRDSTYFRHINGRGGYEDDPSGARLFPQFMSSGNVPCYRRFGAELGEADRRHLVSKSCDTLLSNYPADFANRSYLTPFLGTTQSLLYPLHNRCGFHTSCRRFDLEEKSKLEKTVESLKKDKESKAAGAKQDLPAATGAASTEVAPVKKTIWQRVVAELKHYYHGFRLLAAETRISWGLLRKLMRGETLSRREHKQLVRTVSDIFRLVPFVVILIIPFAEFALPFLLKFFPNMLPSTFEEKSKKEESLRKKLKVKLEMAKFLQETIHETALEHKSKEKSTKAEEFAAFFDRIRVSGESATTEDIMKFAKLFEDDLTLDNLPREVVVAMCRLLDIGTYGLPPDILRFQLRMRLRNLRSDDKMIQMEGIDSLTEDELQSACRARGMRAIGVSEERLRSQLEQWIDLSLNEKVPPSLLLLSRAMYVPDDLTAEEQLKSTISKMPEKLGDEMEVKIAEEEGAKPDYAVKLRLVKEEQAAIKAEEDERKQREADEKEKAAAAFPDPHAVTTPDPVLADVLLKTAELKDIKPEDVTKRDLESVKPLIQEITKEDMDHIEDVIEKITKDKYTLLEQKDLKDEIRDYKEDIQELKAIPEGSELVESKAAKRLTKRVDKMLLSMEKMMKDLEGQKTDLKSEIQDTRSQIKHLQKDDDVDPKKMLDIVDAMDQKKDNVLSIQQLLATMKELSKMPDDARLARVEQVLRMLDIDKDGNIELEHALKVIELLGEQNFKISPKQMEEVVEVLRKEDFLEDSEEAAATKAAVSSVPGGQNGPKAIKDADSSKSDPSNKVPKK